MKRDMDIVRAIAIAATKAPAPFKAMEGVPPESFFEHARLMQEAGLIHADITEFVTGEQQAEVIRLTWEGHEFADKIADETIWGKAKDIALKSGAASSFAILGKVLESLITASLSAKIGIKL